MLNCDSGTSATGGGHGRLVIATWWHMQSALSAAFQFGWPYNWSLAEACSHVVSVWQAEEGEEGKKGLTEAQQAAEDVTALQAM